MFQANNSLHFYSFVYMCPQQSRTSHLKHIPTKNDVIYLQHLKLFEFFLDNYYMLLVSQLKSCPFLDPQVFCVWESVIKL